MTTPFYLISGELFILETFERLESRLLLAAKASFNNGILVITGTGKNDIVEIDGYDENEVPLGAGNVEVILDFSFTPVQFEGVTSIVVNTKGGQDHVRIERTELTGNVTINTGGAVDFVDVGDNSVIGGNLTINTGGGADKVFLGGHNLGNTTSLTVMGQTDVKLGGGNDEIGISYFHGVGQVRIDGGKGFDTLDDFGGNTFDIAPILLKIDKTVLVT